MFATKLDLDAEAEKIKGAAENIFKNGGDFEPMLACFNKGEFKAVVVVRTPDRDLPRDAEAAFAEACMIFTYTHSDEFIVSFSAEVTHEGETHQAINIMFGSREGAHTRVLTYETDIEGNFAGWTDKDLHGLFNSSAISNNMIATLAHFATTHADVQHDLPFAIKALTKRGHMVTVAKELQETLNIE